MPTVNENLSHQRAQIRLYAEILSDGTTTQVEVSDRYSDRYFWKSWSRVAPHRVVAVSRRRKGDPRNPELGARLAIARALRSLADEYEKDLFS
jgi:hypothetical protein